MLLLAPATMWVHAQEPAFGGGRGGITNNLSTAGKLLFTSNGQNLIAFRAGDGKLLWHAGLMAALSAGPISYMIDGKQFLLVAAGDALYSFTVN